MTIVQDVYLGIAKSQGLQAKERGSQISNREGSSNRFLSKCHWDRDLMLCFLKVDFDSLLDL